MIKIEVNHHKGLKANFVVLGLTFFYKIGSRREREKKENDFCFDKVIKKEGKKEGIRSHMLFVLYLQTSLALVLSGQQIKRVDSNPKE